MCCGEIKTLPLGPRRLVNILSSSFKILHTVLKVNMHRGGRDTRILTWEGVRLPHSRNRHFGVNKHPSKKGVYPA